MSIYVTVKIKTEVAKMKLSLHYYSWKGKKKWNCLLAKTSAHSILNEF